MNHVSRRIALPILLSVSGAFGCAAEPATAADGEAASASSEQDLISGRVGAVYTMSNDAASNDIIVFRRAKDGSLQRASSQATAGKGSGDGLGSQGALALTTDRHWLYAVNAGSNELSVFYVQGELLYLVDCIPTNGVRPISVTVSNEIAYVLHAGDATHPGGITGFRQRANGKLSALPSSTQPLSGASVGPAQVAFGPYGSTLIVTEKGTNKIDEYQVDASGHAGAPVVRASTGMTPFGFAVTGRGQAIVSEAFGGAANAGAVSSYQIGASGLAPVSASVPNTESAPCWVVLAHDDGLAFVSNTASGSISSYRVAKDGAVDLIGTDGRSGDTGAGSKPADMALTRNDSFLYVVDGGTGMLGGFRVSSNGALTSITTSISGLPAAAAGLAAQ